MDFQSEKKFWKADTWGFPTIPSNSMYIEVHVEDVEGWNNDGLIFYAFNCTHYAETVNATGNWTGN